MRARGELNDANESIEYGEFYTASWDGRVDERSCGGDRDGVKVEVNRNGPVQG